MLTKNQTIETLSALAKKDKAEIEALIIRDKKLNISFQQRQLDKFDFSQTQALGVRIIYKGQEGSAFTENFNIEAVEETYKEALANAKVLIKNYEPALVSQQKVPLADNLFSAELQNTHVEDKIAIAKILESAALDYNEYITAVPYNSYSDFESDITLFNSHDVYLNYKKNACYVYAYPMAKHGDKVGMALRMNIAKSLKDLDVEKVSQQAAEAAHKKSTAIVPQSCKTPIVFTNYAAAKLIDLLSSHFSAKAMDEKTSLLNNKLNKTIFSSQLSIVDDPFYPNALASRPFDAEGSPSQKNTLIKNGTLTSYITNSVYAKKLNLPNTANAARSPQSELGISTSNLVVEPGSTSYEDLIKKYSNVIVIDNLKGLAGFNSISGDYSIESEGYQYKNGEMTHALANFVLSGNLIETLKNIELVGKDTLMTSSTISPSFLVSELSIAGK